MPGLMKRFIDRPNEQTGNNFEYKTGDPYPAKKRLNNTGISL